jgi:hypothetical protein
MKSPFVVRARGWRYVGPVLLLGSSRHKSRVDRKEQALLDATKGRRRRVWLHVCCEGVSGSFLVFIVILPDDYDYGRCLGHGLVKDRIPLSPF